MFNQSAKRTESFTVVYLTSLQMIARPKSLNQRHSMSEALQNCIDKARIAKILKTCTLKTNSTTTSTKFKKKKENEKKN